MSGISMFTSSVLMPFVEKSLSVLEKVGGGAEWLRGLQLAAKTLALDTVEGVKGYYDSDEFSQLCTAVVTFDKSSVRRVITETIHYMKDVPVENAYLVRNTFRVQPDVVGKPKQNHTHPIAANDRNLRNRFCSSLARSMGREAYYPSRSAPDERRGNNGSREYYWAVDTVMSPKCYDPPKNALLCFIDVEFHISDFPKFLANNTLPCVLYTVQPDSVSKRGTDYSYWFDDKDQIEYHVDGGGVYKHEIWNYGSDHLICVDTIFGVVVRYTAYYCDRRNSCPDHDLVMLTPHGAWDWRSAWFASYFLEGVPLQRLKVSTGFGFNRLIRQGNGEDVKVSIGRCGELLSVTVNLKDEQALRLIQENSKHGLIAAQVQSVVPGESRELAMPLLAYLKADIPKPQSPIIYPVDKAVLTYQFYPGDYDEDAKPLLTPFMPPLVNGAFAPDDSKNNQVAAVQGRINKVKPKLIEPTVFLLEAMDDFLAYLIPDGKVGSCLPVDYDVTWDRMPRPTQRSNLERGLFGLSKAMYEAFIKKEAYLKISDPRIITTINSVDKREYASAMYGFEACMKDQPWYAFSKNPPDIARRVTKVLEKAGFAVATDFSRFDGHVSNVIRIFERTALLRAFPPQYHFWLSELHESQYGLRSVMSRSVKYSGEYARCSGSPETSIFNSLVNAFINFLALLCSGLKPAQAWAKLGIYGGDDGITADCAVKFMKRAADMVGQEMSTEVIIKSKLGIKFLSRYYSDVVWWGSVESASDPMRILAKLHTTPNLPPNVTPKMKFIEKIRCLSLTDYNTPIIGDLCKRVFELAPIDMFDEKKELKSSELVSPLTTWWAQFDRQYNYPNEYGDWMMEIIAKQMPSFNYVLFKRHLGDSKTIDDLMERMPCCYDVPVQIPKQPAIMNGELVPVNAKPGECKINFGGCTWQNAKSVETKSKCQPSNRKPYAKRPATNVAAQSVAKTMSRRQKKNFKRTAKDSSG